jgi:hypothetical protein
MKAIIIQKGVSIWSKDDRNTIGFEKCVNILLSDPSIKMINRDMATTLRLINGYRDSAEHHMIDLLESELYAISQAGVTLFDDLLFLAFNKRLSDHIPNRVLPISTNPPNELVMIIDEKFTQVRKLISPLSRKHAQARAALKSLVLMDRAVRENPNQPTDGELDVILDSISKGSPWTDLFPGIRTVDFSTEGTGLTVNLRISTKEGIPVRLVKEGDEAGTIAVHKTDALSYFNLGLIQIAEKVGLTAPKTLAVIRFLKIQEETDCYREFKIGKSRFKRYSPQAVDKIQKALPGLDIAKIWEDNKKVSN